MKVYHASNREFIDMSEVTQALSQVCSRPDLPEKPFTHRCKLASRREVVRSMLFETGFRWCMTSWMRRPNYSSAIVLVDKCNTARRVLFLLLVRIF